MTVDEVIQKTKEELQETISSVENRNDIVQEVVVMELERKVKYLKRLHKLKKEILQYTDKIEDKGLKKNEKTPKI
ncbi:MAG: hypothetical protein JJT76_13390 [Clostridiaceae bacterium]|nr:hypothetical protein [Clostridiaceae bacterium]